MQPDRDYIGALGRSWDALGALLGALGMLLDALGTLLDALGHSCSTKIAPQQLPRAILGDLDTILSRFWLFGDRVWDVQDPQNQAPVQARA